MTATYRVRRVTVIPDKVDVIAEELRKFSRDFSLVLTSGGIGPTYDNVTYEAAAAAFDDCLKRTHTSAASYSPGSRLLTGASPASS